MTHMKPMEENEGHFDLAIPAGRVCRKCGQGPVRRELWHSHDGGYEDARYTCGACGHIWWIDGIDS